MYFSKREKIILQLLLEQQTGVTLEYLSEQLKVSTRTIYREISSLESTLAHYQIRIERDNYQGYRLLGTKTAFGELEKDLGTRVSELSSQQRQKALIILLLNQEEDLKMEALAQELNVSTGTIQADLESIEEILSEFEVQLLRQKARGISVRASEKAYRLIISGLMNSEINEYDFFQLMEGSEPGEEDLHPPDNYFLRQMNIADLRVAYAIIKQYGANFFEEVTDTQLQRIVILMGLTIMRLQQGKMIQEESKIFQESVGRNSKKIAESIFSELKAVRSLESTDGEIDFFALQLQGLSVPIRKEIFLDEYDTDLAFKVRELIRDVSVTLGIHFHQDDTLFADLLAHIQAAIRRVVAPVPEGKNTLLEKIEKQYPEITSAVKEGLKKVFPEVSFLDNETLYIVIHFASAFERIPQQYNISALVICSSGVGTAKILESRLRKNIPEITSIKISRISRLAGEAVDQYDLILSTLFLPGFEAEYKVVTPLLLEEEIKSIQAYLKEQQLNKVRDQALKKEPISMGKTDDELNFKEYYEKISISNSILENFCLETVPSGKELPEILQEICRRLEGKVIKDPEAVAQALVNRMEMAPIGIPDTHMALFHTISTDIRIPFFGVFELETPLEIMAVNKETISLNRILLMLGPSPLSESEQEVLGNISAAMVEDAFNTELFNSGSRKLLTDFLSNLFLEKLKK